MTAVIDTIRGEDSNLALHVQLCEQRYAQLIGRIDVIDQNLSEINTTLSHIQQRLETDHAARYQTYLGWAGALITVLLGAVVSLVLL
jgi:tetrahydromethanopterin S-methyltransferase subunit G